MNWIANMPGPSFLSFYFIIILAVMISYFIFRFFATDRSHRILALLASLLLIDGLGGYKLVVALSNGHNNVGFLITLAFISNFILLLSLASSRSGSYRGSRASAAGTGVYFSTWDHSSSSSSCSSSSTCSSSSSCSSGGGCGGCGGGGGGD